MKGSYVVLRIRLEAIQNFLEHVKIEAETEIQAVLARKESGDFQELDDLDNALHHPIARQEIAARAVYYELNALIEHELQRSAHLPWLELAYLDLLLVWQLRRSETMAAQTLLGRRLRCLLLGIASRHLLVVISPWRSPLGYTRLRGFRITTITNGQTFICVFRFATHLHHSL